MRPLIIDEAFRAQVNAVKEHAEANIFTLQEEYAVMHGKKPPAGDRKGFSFKTKFGYKIVFSYEEQSAGMIRHFSMSVPTEGKVPHPLVIQEVMKAFGFKGSLEDCMVDIEDGTAVNVWELIGPEEGIMYRAPKKTS